MVPELRQPRHPADALRIEVIIPLVERYGPRIMQIPPSQRIRKFDYNKGVVRNPSTHETLFAEYDAYTRDLNTTYLRYDDVGKLEEKREFKADWAFGYFTLQVTKGESSGRSTTVRHRVGLRYGPINRTRLHPDTADELQHTQEQLDRLLPKI